MSTRTIVYGNVFDPDKREKLDQDQTDKPVEIFFRGEPTLNGIEGPLTVFIDLDDPTFNNPDFIVSLATAGQQLKLIGKAAEPDLDQSIKVAKMGVAEVLTADQCLDRLHQFMKQLEMPDPAPPKENAELQYGLKSLVGASRQMKEIRHTIETLGTVDFPSALILGETGTGKSLLSRVLHHTGVRANHNLVEVNCSAIPDELFESELFGHIKGAFTDAKAGKTGLFEYADNGTLFLDEIGNLSHSAQAKLLKILEDKKLRKVGAIDELEISVRVVAATNTDLEKAIADGRFRQDLYYRINLLSLELPPLRTRPKDIETLARHYLKYFATIYSKAASDLDSGACEVLLAHAWPGNVRELCNVIERAVLLSAGEVLDATAITTAITRGRITTAERKEFRIELPAHGCALDEIQGQIVRHVLNMFDWNKSEAARYLQVSRPRLRRIIEASGIEQDRRIG